MAAQRDFGHASMRLVRRAGGPLPCDADERRGLGGKTTGGGGRTGDAVVESSFRPAAVDATALEEHKRRMRDVAASMADLVEAERVRSGPDRIISRVINSNHEQYLQFNNDVPVYSAPPAPQPHGLTIRTYPQRPALKIPVVSGPDELSDTPPHVRLTR